MKNLYRRASAAVEHRQPASFSKMNEQFLRERYLTFVCVNKGSQIDVCKDGRDCRASCQQKLIWTVYLNQIYSCHMAWVLTTCGPTSHETC